MSGGSRDTREARGEFRAREDCDVRLSGLLVLVCSIIVPTSAFALTVDPGGPWRVAEGGELVIRPVVSNSVGTVEYAWDLDGDGVFDDSGEATATFSALGIDGPSAGFTVGLVVADDVDQTLVEIPVDVTNAPPTFVDEAPNRAVIGREWTWTPVVRDDGNDPFELTVNTDDLPLGMTWDALLQTFSWTPNEGHLLQGEPPGNYAFRVTAEDEDRGRTNYDVQITVVRNNPPPVPPIVYPDGIENVRTNQPTIILSNVDDPDGDPVTYWVQVDSNPCFCSAENLESGPLVEGEFATQWRLPRPLLAQLGDPPKTYYVQRWANDGLEDSTQELSLFNVEVTEDGGGDADADADADSDADADADADTPRKSRGCGAAPGAPSTGGWAAFAALAAALIVTRRRPR